MSLLTKLTTIVGEAFSAENLDPSLGIVKVSDRPDLAQFQCNGALAAAKVAKQNPRMIAEKIADHIRSSEIIEEVSIAGPGFLNLTLKDEFLSASLTDPTYQNWKLQTSEKIILDYGGPNVAKPLHVGHLRAAIIGEALKRIFLEAGADVIGDVHLGDWGLQMGQLISELELTRPELPYFTKGYDHPHPEESPVSLSDLEVLYPIASARCKEDKARLDKARKATFALQAGDPGYTALWQHFVSVSKAAIKQEYDELNVFFDLWKGEADAHPLIESMMADLSARDLSEESDGAIIFRVNREDDNKKIPPLMLMTSEGSVGYHTTDMATIQDRIANFQPDRMLYVVDQRQALHFEQVFRAVDKAGYYPESKLEHLGFGTMNGSDGKPFKTREGGVLRLRDMIDMVEERAKSRIEASGIAVGYSAEETNDISHKIGIAALKFADLSNPRTSDYIFDLDRFMAFEGKTGPYLLYASVRIRSVLKKAEASLAQKTGEIALSTNEERDLALAILQYPENLKSAVEKRMPHILCDHAYALAQTFSKFYASNRIADEADEAIKTSRIALIHLVGKQLDATLNLLGIDVPERM